MGLFSSTALPERGQASSRVSETHHRVANDGEDEGDQDDDVEDEHHPTERLACLALGKVRPASTERPSRSNGCLLKLKLSTDESVELTKVMSELALLPAGHGSVQVGICQLLGHLAEKLNPAF